MHIVSIKDNLHEMSKPLFLEKIRKLFQNINGEFAWNVKACFLEKIRKLKNLKMPSAEIFTQSAKH